MYYYSFRLTIFNKNHSINTLYYHISYYKRDILPFINPRIPVCPHRLKLYLSVLSGSRWYVWHYHFDTLKYTDSSQVSSASSPMTREGCFLDLPSEVVGARYHNERLSPSNANSGENQVKFKLDKRASRGLKLRETLSLLAEFFWGREAHCSHYWGVGDSEIPRTDSLIIARSIDLHSLSI